LLDIIESFQAPIIWAWPNHLSSSKAHSLVVRFILYVVDLMIYSKQLQIESRLIISFNLTYLVTSGHFTYETESPWPWHFKHSHRWKRQSWSKFASHYAWGTNWVCECKVDVKSTWISTRHQMDHVSWSLGLFSKTTSWR
jgi:hypothetical protein